MKQNMEMQNTAKMNELLTKDKNKMWKEIKKYKNKNSRGRDEQNELCNCKLCNE